MGWLKDWFDPDFKDGHRDGDTYASNIEYDIMGSTHRALYGTYTLSIYRVRGGRQGKSPVYVKSVDLYEHGRERHVKRELERESDEWVRNEIEGKN